MAACMNDMPARKCLFACCGQGGHLVFSNDDRETTNYEGATRMSVVQIPLLVIVLSCLVMSCLSVLFCFPSPSLLFFFFTNLQSRHDVFFRAYVGQMGGHGETDDRPVGPNQALSCGSPLLIVFWATTICGRQALQGLGLGLGLLSICGESERGGARNGMFGWGGWLV